MGEGPKYRFYPNNMRRRIFLGAAATLFAAPAISRVADRSWTVIGMTDFPPYNYISDEKYIGTDIDILTVAARRMDVRMNFVPLPWPRVLLALERYEADALFQLAPIPKRFVDWHMAGPMRITRQVFVVRKDSGIRDITRLEDLAGLSVGVVNEFHYTPEFNSSRHFIHEGSVDDRTSLRKLLLNRADLIVGGEANLRYAINKSGASDLVRILPTPLVDQDRYVGFRRDPGGRAKSVLMQQALTEMALDGTTSAIIKRIAKG